MRIRCKYSTLSIAQRNHSVKCLYYWNEKYCYNNLIGFQPFVALRKRQFICEHIANPLMSIKYFSSTYKKKGQFWPLYQTSQIVQQPPTLKKHKNFVHANMHRCQSPPESIKYPISYAHTPPSLNASNYPRISVCSFLVYWYIYSVYT